MRRSFWVFGLAVGLAGCGGGGAADVAASTTSITLPPSSSSTTTMPTTTTTVVEVTTTTSTTTEAPTAAEADTSGIELTWAAEGTVEADVERAFWNATPARLDIYTEDVLDPNYEPFVSTHTGRDLERIQTDVARFIAENNFLRYPEPSETQITFIAVGTETEALVRVCELDRGELYYAGEFEGDEDLDSDFQARFVLVDGEWLWEETTVFKYEPLEGERPTCWEDSGT